MHCRQFFWLERKLNLGANLCIKVTWLIGFGPWQLIWDLKDLNNSCIFCFICSTFQKKVTKNKNRAGTAVQQVFTYVSSILIFFPNRNLQKGVVFLKQNNDEGLSLWPVSAPFLPAIFYGSRFPTCLVLRRISFFLGIPCVRKCQWHRWEWLSFHFLGLCMGGHSPTLIAKDCEGERGRGRGEDEKFPGKHSSRWPGLLNK